MTTKIGRRSFLAGLGAAVALGPSTVRAAMAPTYVGEITVNVSVSWETLTAEEIRADIAAMIESLVKATADATDRKLIVSQDFVREFLLERPRSKRTGRVATPLVVATPAE